MWNQRLTKQPRKWYDKLLCDQEEKRQLRQDACQLAEAQHEALLQAKAHVDDLQSDKARVAGIVGELKAALEQSVQARDGLQLTVQSLEGLKAELTAARWAGDKPTLCCRLLADFWQPSAVFRLHTAI